MCHSINSDFIKNYLSIIKRKCRYWENTSNLKKLFHSKIMTDLTLYISMILGFGGIYVLISSFHDDDDDDSDDGEKYFYNFEFTNFAK